jgi:hypothetical protein
MSTQIQAPQAPSAWWRWRKARPFWGGLFLIVSGIEILLAVWAPLPVVMHVGLQGLVGYLVPVILLLCGILLLANPAQRLFYSTVAAVLSLASWATSNLGGFLFGMLLGLIGSALAFAWTPDRKRKQPRRHAQTSAPAPPAAPAAATWPEPAAPAQWPPSAAPATWPQADNAASWPEADTPVAWPQPATPAGSPEPAVSPGPAEAAASTGPAEPAVSPGPAEAAAAPPPATPDTGGDLGPEPTPKRPGRLR